ncbi:MAG: bifunctional nuclease family protein [Propionibacteriaceae bacterium]|nr:bifunctional nuclease family protein [Propionibacteriaceae bacterium]
MGIRLVFSEVRVTAVADTPVLLLREEHGTRILPVWITAAGGNAILSAHEDSDEVHPGTHDLMVETLGVLDATVEEVHIVDVDEGIFTAAIMVAGLSVTARVSDAVALALRCGASILVTEQVMDEASVGHGVAPRPASADDDHAPNQPIGDAQMDEFRAFLDSINPEDFGPSPQQP